MKESQNVNLRWKGIDITGMDANTTYLERGIEFADNGSLSLTSYVKMNLDQAFRPPTAGFVHVPKGLHCWHRYSRRDNLVVRPPLFGTEISDLDRLTATDEMEVCRTYMQNASLCD